MLLKNYRSFLRTVFSGESPMNGMYLLYSVAADTALPTVTTDNTLQDIVGMVDGSAVLGIVRISNTASGILSTGIQFISTTHNAQTVAGMAFASGVYARAVMLSSFETLSSADQGLDYNVLSTAVVVPANGSVTLTDEVTI